MSKTLKNFNFSLWPTQLTYIKFHVVHTYYTNVNLLYCKYNFIKINLVCMHLSTYWLVGSDNLMKAVEAVAVILAGTSLLQIKEKVQSPPEGT